MRRMNQILGLFFSKDVRKQNPNDFAKPGRDLENNQASLFEKLHSSESAKHERQRIFGPLAALTFNLVVAVGIIFLNKWVLENVGFQFPVCLTVIHYAVSWALMASLKFFSILPASPSSELAPLSLFTFGFVNSVSTGLANVSLKYNSVGFYQMAKIAITPLIVLAEFIWYKKRIAFSKINVEDYTNHFGFFGFYDSFGSSWFACVPLELQQYISHSHVCFSWLLASVVKCFGTWVSSN
uniref:Sugar phosphate transporter domain-containing protein n=1 Tax=Gossypium raimondii TaxID=29730 RepID=A0A0D2MK42_GOSRA|nr:hypothetical protein B456_003G068600 [Gossypium raimondii]